MDGQPHFFGSPNASKPRSLFRHEIIAYCRVRNGRDGVGAAAELKHLA
jgi:hypothetical protein